jgi:hypothetical protein
MLRLILLTPIESGTSTWKSLWSYCLFNCWPSVQVRVIQLIISPWFTTPNKTSALNAGPFKCSAFISVCCQLYCSCSSNLSSYWLILKQQCIIAKPGRDDPWVGPFQNCVRQPCPLIKMAAVTKNRNFFNYALLL